MPKQDNSYKKSTIKANILHFIELQGITKYVFYKNTGITRGILDQNTGISEENIARFLAYYPNVNTDWLILGIGPIYKDKLVEKSNIASETSKPIDKPIITLHSDLKTSNISIPVTDIKVAAGSGIYNGQVQFDEYIQLPQHFIKRGAKYFCVRVKGDSMSPTLQDSSYIIIRHLDKSEWESIPDEHIYVVVDKDGKSFVKRVKNRFKKGFIVLMSDNIDKAYNPNFNLTHDEIVSIFHAEWYISAKMPNINNTMFGRLKRLEDMVENLLAR